MGGTERGECNDSSSPQLPLLPHTCRDEPFAPLGDGVRGGEPSRPDARPDARPVESGVRGVRGGVLVLLLVLLRRHRCSERGEPGELGPCCCTC